MAKKYAFKPDKNGASLLSRLYLTKKQRQSVLKWGLYALVLLVLSVLQDVVLCRIRIGGATTELVPCAIFLVCVMEGLEKGSVFALCASLLYLFSGSAPGAFCVVYITFAAVGVSFLQQSYLQKSFGAALICTALAMFVYELAVFITGLFLQLTLGVRILGFLITAALTCLSIPVLYPVFHAIGKIGGDAWTE